MTKKILIVEDETKLMRTVRLYLEQAGYSVVWAEDGQQGLAAFRLRYTPAGTRVTVAARPAPGGIELFINDTGLGIPPEELPHVFDRFWRAEKSRNRATGGSCLGLAIVKQLVEAHGGQVQVESEVNVGTRFRIYLPCASTR